MAFKFPFTNYHELNLTWVLDKLKELFEESAENVTTIETYEDRLTAVETELPSVSETASEASRAAAAAGTLAQTAKTKHTLTVATHMLKRLDKFCLRQKIHRITVIETSTIFRQAHKKEKEK